MIALRFLLLTLLTTVSYRNATAQEEVVPDSLLNWLRIVQSDGYRLVYAADKEGHFYAFYVDQDGDLLIANHCHDKNLAIDGSAFRVSDPESDRDLHDLTSKKEGPDYKRITYTIRSAAGSSTKEISMTTVYPTGILYPLKTTKPGVVRVQILVGELPNQRTLLDEKVTLLRPPKKR
jgi:hypothetical protein